ncbi:hypothetical protein AZE42_12050 [Rhizopogon vesiculosus]|uniref:Uncharacterized protein n=1 Tax=Rhizopogon vesiculosus TaxID=180088 RepID=A0A1J8Q1Y7_9AGAM|nr:hypothetical protein AZE42_12050 [Rhizopogon vesiculosus]
MNASTLARISAASTSNLITTIQQTQVPSKAEFTPATDVHPVAPAHRSNIQLLLEPSSLFLPSNKGRDKGKGKCRDAKPLLTHAQCLLTCTQKQCWRQAVGGYKYDNIPSIDLRRTPSSASTSQLPHSNGSMSASVSCLLHRYSLPVQSTPLAVPAELSSYITTLDLPGPAALPVPPVPIMPADIPLATSVGFSTLISCIAAAHGFMPSIVLEVYKCVGSLKEAEKFVRGMHNIAEEWIGAKFEQREQEAHGTGKISKWQNDGESSSESGDDASRDSCHEGSLQPDPLEHWMPNGLHIWYIPGESDYEPPPTSHRDPEHVPVQNRAVLDGDSLDVCCTCSVSLPWSVDEDRAFLSENWEMLKMLERQWGKRGIMQRFMQLL